MPQRKIGVAAAEASWKVARCPHFLAHSEDHRMPTLVNDNVPVSLFDRIQRLAKAQQQTPADWAR